MSTSQTSKTNNSDNNNPKMSFTYGSYMISLVQTTQGAASLSVIDNHQKWVKTYHIPNCTPIKSQLPNQPNIFITFPMWHNMLKHLTTIGTNRPTPSTTKHEWRSSIDSFTHTDKDIVIKIHVDFGGGAGIVDTELHIPEDLQMSFTYQHYLISVVRSPVKPMSQALSIIDWNTAKIYDLPKCGYIVTKQDGDEAGVWVSFGDMCMMFHRLIAQGIKRLLDSEIEVGRASSVDSFVCGDGKIVIKVHTKYKSSPRGFDLEFIVPEVVNEKMSTSKGVDLKFVVPDVVKDKDTDKEKISEPVELDEPDCSSSSTLRFRGLKDS